MAVVMCLRCNKYVDLDYHADDVVVVGLDFVHWDCLSEEELEIIEKNGEDGLAEC